MIPALGVVAVGMILNISGIIAQASGTDGSDLAAYVSGGGSAAAVGGLVYVARKIFSGDLISRPTAVAEQELVRLINASHSREEDLQKCMQSTQVRERRNDELTEKLIETIADVKRWTSHG